MMNFHFGLDLKLLTFSISKCISNHIENICQVNDILLPGKTNFERSRMEILFLTVKILFKSANLKTLISILFLMPQKINEGFQRTFSKSVTILDLFGKRCITLMDIINIIL